MRLHSILAIFKRNFVSYFSSPIGYVFICAFVLLSAAAAFWPNEFFNANLANLDQLNRKLPWIMLVFIPAITMAIWADERRQGTDELLLTLPATDLEVVLGKYLASLAIFGVALLFSLSNLFVLAGLGHPDVGLLFANYVGYLLVGAAMISIGMVASFLTSNLTVGFILAVAFNAPLIFAESADAIIPSESAARFVKSFGFVAQFGDFGRGLITLSSVVYFAGIVTVMLYLSMVLIGRRHWVGRSRAVPVTVPMSTHYLLRAVGLAAIGVGLTTLAVRFDLRADATSERLSSLSPQTEALLAGLSTDRPVFIEAYISPEVPQSYVQTRLNLLSTLREADVLGGDAVVVRLNDTERFSKEASEAEEQFGITARQVPSTTGGKLALEEIHLGVAFMCGLDRVVVPFFDRGIPVEYEVVRSIATVSGQKRKKIGVLATDARLFGGFEMETMSRRPDQQIVTELQKQYEVVQVNADQPIGDDYDVLLAVQPSSLPQAQLDNLIAAIRRGVPTAIFEDPMPFLDGSIPGTSEPRRPANRNPFMQQNQPPPEPKGDIQTLWQLLGAQVDDDTIVYDEYNPYPKIEDFYPEFVFVGDPSPGTEPFNPTSEITDQLRQVVMLFSGSIMNRPGATTTSTPLLRTGRQTGTVAYSEIVRRNIFGMSSLNPVRRFVPTRESYVLATHVTGPAPEDDAADASADDAEAKPAKRGPMNVILVADTDCLQSAFFAMRQRGQDAQDPVQFEFDNVTFVLNALDALAGDERFMTIRGRRPDYRTLVAVERRTEEARTKATEERRSFLDRFEEQRAAEEKKLKEEVDKLKARSDVDARELGLEVAMKQQVGENRLQARIDQLEAERDRELERIERDLALEIRQVQGTYKLAAVGLPPIPPLIVAGIVLMRRRSHEKIGVPKSRMRHASGGGMPSPA